MEYNERQKEGWALEGFLAHPSFCFCPELPGSADGGAYRMSWQIFNTE